MKAPSEALEEIDCGSHSAQAVFVRQPPQQAKQSFWLLSRRSC
jgi:hypothetical protein